MKIEDTSILPAGMKLTNAYAVQAADRLISLKETKDVWTVIEECMNIWAASHPNEWQSYLINIDNVRQTREDKKFGYNKKHGLRYTLDIPQPVMMMIRMLYTPEELPMRDKEFFLQWAKRFPKMKVVEKV